MRNPRNAEERSYAPKIAEVHICTLTYKHGKKEQPSYVCGLLTGGVHA
jgi:hypothetical protein